jgi:hypothetical protein
MICKGLKADQTGRHPGKPCPESSKCLPESQS